MKKYLRKNNMTGVEFSRRIGCSRQIIWKVQKGISISPEVAYKILLETKGDVLPLCTKKGRKRKEKA